MAFFLRPTIFTPAYCGPTARYAPSRPRYSYSQPSFIPFLSQVDDLVNEIHREAQREAQREARRAARREYERRILNPRFDVKETSEGYQVGGAVPGFEQENLEIEVSDEYTLAIKADTEKKTEAPAAAPVEEKAATTESESEKMEGVTIAETEVADDNKSDAGSHKSYQATVEDDFEDLGAETSSTLSTGSDTPTTSSKGKEKAVEEPAAARATTEQTTEQRPQEQEQQEKQEENDWLNERVRGSFIRTFRFPSRIDGAGARASLKNGVLSITIPKAPVPEVRNITIQ